SLVNKNIMDMLSLVYSGATHVVLIASTIMWAGIQRKIILHLKAALARMCQKFHPQKYEPSNRSLTEVDQSEISEGALYLSFYWLLHLSMYFSFVKSDSSIGSQSIQAMIISLVPLVIPYKLYLKWPVISRGFLMCWAQIWLQGIHMWLIGMVSPLVCVIDFELTCKLPPKSLSLVLLVFYATSHI
ncbi:hypothetical protein M441DRAFT_153901, partial [Trichoderma asperellum CBS 433.97]